MARAGRPRPANEVRKIRVTMHRITGCIPALTGRGYNPWREPGDTVTTSANVSEPE